MRKALAKLLVAITLLSSAPAPLWAHAALKRSTPAAGAHLAQVPTVLRLDFTETLELNFASLRLVSSSGREIALGPLAYAPDSRRSLVASVKGAMDAGTYVVMWQVAGDDGHSVRADSSSWSLQARWGPTPHPADARYAPRSGRDAGG